MNNPKLFLSIIIPVYNAEKHLQDCLDSCINQDFSHEEYEIICVNDGSTDNSASILSNYEKNYQNIVVVNQSNSGASSARNNGIKKAKGDYVWFVDSDDFIPAGFIKNIHDTYYCEKYDMILFGAYAFVESFSAEETEQHIKGTLRPNQAIQSIYITRRLIRKSYLESHNILFHEKITYGEDALFDYMIYMNRPKVAVFDELGYFYRIHSGSIMRNKSRESKIRFIDSHLTAIEIIKSFYDKEEKKRFRTINYILDDVQSILDVVSGLPFDNAKGEIRKLQKADVLPFKKHAGFNKKDILITLYTNIKCYMYSFLIRISASKIGFSVLKRESKFMNGKTMKRIIHFLKKKYNHLSKD